MLGLPQFTLGHPTRVAMLDSTSQRNAGLYVTGNYLQGVSVANCLSAAAQTAVHVDAGLARQARGTIANIGRTLL
jgi:oxygen-dependent protoporphyrinogen oxidase